MIKVRVYAEIYFENKIKNRFLYSKLPRTGGGRV